MQMIEPRSVVLVVEDEPIIRLNAIEMVEGADFEALEAGNAAEALNILERRQDICVVFTDIEMPGGIDGIALATTIRSRWPSIELILTSGRLNTPLRHIPTRGLFFAKPYDERAVVSAMREFCHTPLSLLH